MFGPGLAAMVAWLLGGYRLSSALGCSARNIPAWSAATACQEEPCPDNPDVQLVRPDQPHWQNALLHFNPDSRLPTPAQKAELLRRDGYRCKIPGCPHHLEIAFTATDCSIAERRATLSSQARKWAVSVAIGTRPVEGKWPR